MTTTGQLALGAAQIISTANGELIGHAFTEATPQGQLQRWILYNNPQNSFEIRPPSSAMAGCSLADWKASVPSLWRPGAFYVRANANIYHYGETYLGVQWIQIPKASHLPDPSYPEGLGDPHQLDPIGSKIIHISQDGCHGFAFTVNGLLDASSVEYWMLPSSYQPAGGGSTAAVTMESEVAHSLDQFIDHANQSFGPGCRLVITGCVNYSGFQPPAIL
jgi:hypothetical protein